MTPQPSCPSSPGAVGNCIHSGPAQGVRFEAQTPQPSSLTRTWPGPGAGRATSPIRRRPGPSRMAARMEARRSAAGVAIKASVMLISSRDLDVGLAAVERHGRRLALEPGNGGAQALLEGRAGLPAEQALG